MIKITSHENADTVSYSLPLVVGEVVGVDEGEIEVCCNSRSTVVWPVIKGKFKVLVNVTPGPNEIVFRCDSAENELHLVYEPLTLRKFIRLVYIICADDAGRFQAPIGENNSSSSACARIGLGAQMLQTFTADKLNACGLGFKTFKLEEEFGKPICHIFRSSLCLDDALKLSENELWNHFALELMKSPLRAGDDCKFLAFLSFTHYENNTKKEPESFNSIKLMTKGYVALATGGLALLGSACLHTWPQTLSEVPWRFGDSRKIDKLLFMDDSGNRGTHWGCYATTLGATMHELGHVFNLGHTTEGIMSRGFDSMHRYFLIDLFYCSHSFQKNHNPYYEKGVHEKDNSVSLAKAEGITWTTNQQAAELTHSPTSDNAKPTNDEKLQSTNSTKPPWRVPDPDKAGCGENDIDGPVWARPSALILYYHKWLNNYEEEENCITRDGTKFSSPNGIRIVEFRDETGLGFHHLEFLEDEGAPEINISSADMKEHKLDEMKNVTVHVQDDQGNICLHTFAQVYRSDRRL